MLGTEGSDSDGTLVGDRGIGCDWPFPDWWVSASPSERHS